MRSGSEATLKPLAYRLDQRGVSITVTPCVSLATLILKVIYHNIVR